MLNLDCQFFSLPKFYAIQFTHHRHAVVNTSLTREHQGNPNGTQIMISVGNSSIHAVHSNNEQ